MDEKHGEKVSRKPIEKSQIELSVVAPCYNEQDNIPLLVHKLQKLFSEKNISAEIILIDDASRDDTKKVIESIAREYQGVIGVFHKENKGIVGGWRSGLGASKGTYVCFIDSDLQNPPEEIWRLLKEIRHCDVDIVQGTRSSIGRLKDGRYYYSRFLNWLLNVMFSMNATDNKSGFVLAQKYILEDVLTHQFNYKFYHTFISVAAKYRGYKIKEVETLFQDRHSGVSFMNRFPFAVVITVLLEIIKAFVEFRFYKIPDVFSQDLAKVTDINSCQIAYRGWRRWLFEFYFLTMPLHKWLIRGRVRRFYILQKKAEILPHEKIKELQLLRLRRLVQHAFVRVPYYRELFINNGIRPEDIRTLDDLKHIPILEKQALREHLYFDLFSSTHKKSEMLKISTSGSTGEPLVTYADRFQLEMRLASTLSAMEWAGWQFGDKQARLWHQTIGMSRDQIIKEYLDALLMRRLFIPAYEIGQDNVDELMQKLAKHNPVLLDGYAESFNLLAQYAAAKHKNNFMAKSIISSAQVMPDSVRHDIEKQFDTKIFDKYGSREFSGIAYECQSHNGHHIMGHSYIVELLHNNKDASPGELGEVIITDLNNFSVPLIRYRIGDLATAVDNNIACECGRGLPRLGSIEGRSQAIIIGANGMWLPSTFFAHFFKEYNQEIRQYQLIQEASGIIILNIVRNYVYPESIAHEIIRKLKEFLGQDMQININYTDSIPLGPTGKRISVISKLPVDFQKL